MSAFIVPDKTINEILSYLNANTRGGYADYAFRQLGYDLRNSDSLAELGSALYLLNCDAVDDRYGKGTAARDAQATDYRFKFERCSAVQAYKSATCLRYQCSEGDVPKRPLYEALDDTIAGIASAIISALPEYDQAGWGK